MGLSLIHIQMCIRDRAYAGLENSVFTAVCDANYERAKAFADAYHVKAYTDIAEMIQTCLLYTSNT